MGPQMNHQVERASPEREMSTGRRGRAPRIRPTRAEYKNLPGRWFTHLLYVVNGLLLLAIILLSVVLIRSR